MGGAGAGAGAGPSVVVAAAAAARPAVVLRQMHSELLSDERWSAWACQGVELE